jgi:HlyD family type I secretion membrane fusion protein
MQSAVKSGLVTLLVSFGGLGSWAALAPLDGAVVGSGTLVVHGNRKTVQHREGGIVETLAVAEGDHVTQGQILIHLDGTQAKANLAVHDAALAGDLALTARDLAEIAGDGTIDFPASLRASDPASAAVMSRETTVFRNHRALLHDQLAVIDQRIVQAHRQAEGSQAQYQAAIHGLGLAEQELDAFNTLTQSGLASRTRVLELARGVDQLRGDVGQMQSDIARHAAEAAELDAEKLRLQAAAQADATHELREAQLRINDVLPRIAADHDLLNRLDIRAPASGEVVDQTVFTKGGVIEPGKPILDIVPAHQTMIAEAEIRPEDIENLHVGQRARVVATGFNPRQTQALEGRIDIISADRITDPRSGRSYYKVQVTLLSDQENGKLLQRLGPGMPVEVIVPVKARTALDYLLEPLRSSLRHTGNEV